MVFAWIGWAELAGRPSHEKTVRYEACFTEWLIADVIWKVQVAQKIVVLKKKGV